MVEDLAKEDTCRRMPFRKSRARPTIFLTSASLDSSTSLTASVVICSHRVGVKCRPGKLASLSRASDASSLTCGEPPSNIRQYSMPCPGLGSARSRQRSAIWPGRCVKHPLGSVSQDARVERLDLLSHLRCSRIAPETLLPQPPVHLTGICQHCGHVKPGRAGTGRRARRRRPDRRRRPICGHVPCCG